MKYDKLWHQLIHDKSQASSTDKKLIYFICEKLKKEIEKDQRFNFIKCF